MWTRGCDDGDHLYLFDLLITLAFDKYRTMTAVSSPDPPLSQSSAAHPRLPAFKHFHSSALRLYGVFVNFLFCFGVWKLLWCVWLTLHCQHRWPTQAMLFHFVFVLARACVQLRRFISFKSERVTHTRAFRKRRNIRNQCWWRCCYAPIILSIYFVSGIFLSCPERFQPVFWAAAVVE